MQGRKLHLRKARRPDYAKLGGGEDDSSDGEIWSSEECAEATENVRIPARDATACLTSSLEELHNTWHCRGSVHPVLLSLNSTPALLPETLSTILGADLQVACFSCDQQRDCTEQWPLQQYCIYWHERAQAGHGSGIRSSKPDADGGNYLTEASPQQPAQPLISMEIPIHNNALKDRIERPAFLSACDLLMRPVHAAGEAPESSDLLPAEQHEDTGVHATPTGGYHNFAIQSGGASTWIWVLTGKQMVLLIPPEPANLAAYAAWSQRAQHAGSTLSRHTSGNLRADLGPGSCLLIPAGWAYAVCTDEAAISLQGCFHPAACLGMQATILRLAKKLSLSRAAHHTQALWHMAQLYTDRLRQHAGLSQQQLQQRAQQRVTKQLAAAAAEQAAKRAAQQAAAKRKAAVQPAESDDDVSLSESDDDEAAVGARPQRLATRRSGMQRRGAAEAETSGRRPLRSVKRKQWDAAFVGGEDDDLDSDDEPSSRQPTMKLRSAPPASPGPPAHPQKCRKLLVKLGSLTQPRQAPTNAELRAASQQLPSQGQQQARPSGGLVVKLGGNRRASEADQQAKKGSGRLKKHEPVIPQSDGAGDGVSDAEEADVPAEPTAATIEAAAGTVKPLEHPSQLSPVQADHKQASEPEQQAASPKQLPASAADSLHDIAESAGPAADSAAAMTSPGAAPSAADSGADAQPRQADPVRSPAEAMQHESEDNAADAPQNLAARGSLMRRKFDLKSAGPVALGSSKGAGKTPAAAARKPVLKSARPHSTSISPAPRREKDPEQLLALAGLLSAEKPLVQPQLTSPQQQHSEPQHQKIPTDSLTSNQQAASGRAVSATQKPPVSSAEHVHASEQQAAQQRRPADEAQKGSNEQQSATQHHGQQLQAKVAAAAAAAAACPAVHQHKTSQPAAIESVYTGAADVHMTDAEAPTAARSSSPDEDAPNDASLPQPAAEVAPRVAESAHESAHEAVLATQLYSLPAPEEVDQQLADLRQAARAAACPALDWNASEPMTEAEWEGVGQLHALLAEQAHVAAWWRPVFADAQQAQLSVAMLAESIRANGRPLDNAPILSLPQLDYKTLLPPHSSPAAKSQPKQAASDISDAHATGSGSDSKGTHDEEADIEEEGDSVLEQQLREGKRPGAAERNRPRVTGSVRSRLMKKLRFK